MKGSVKADVLCGDAGCWKEVCLCVYVGWGGGGGGWLQPTKEWEL